MSYQSLEEALQTVGSPVKLLRDSQIGPYAFPGCVPSSRIGEMNNVPGGRPALFSTCLTI